MNIAVIGGGRVGLPTAAGLAMLGHCVVCCECDSNKRNIAAGGRAPFADSGLDNALAESVKSGMLRFCADVSVAVAKADSVIVTVPVSDAKNGLEELYKITAEVATNAPPFCVLIIKSTVPPGTCANLQKMINIRIVANPEFLRQGHGFNDFMSPSRIIAGGDDARALKTVRTVYAPFIKNGIKYIETNFVSAEITKLAANMFLSSRVALINETADLCEALGGNITNVISAITADKRIGADYLRPSVGFGGACLPKDGRLLMAAAEQQDTAMPATKAVYDSNQNRIRRISAQILALSPKKPIIAVWGVSFKPEADSICDSPAVLIMQDLYARGCQLQVHEPFVEKKVLRRAFPSAIFFDNHMAALANADTLVVVNKSESLLSTSPAIVLQAMKGRLVFDYAGIFNRIESKKIGFILHTIGMPRPI